jgi:WD40 repeat protein
VELVHSNGIASVAFSPDGKYVATGGGGRSRIWLTATGEPLSPWMEQATFVVFSPVAAVLATGDYDGSVRVWTVPEGKPLPRMEGRHDGLLAIDISPDGRLIATGGTDHTARLWNAETGVPTRVVLVLEGVVDDVTFSPDGRWLLTTSRDCTVRLWSVATGEQIGPSLRHQHVVLEGGFSPDGSQIIAADAVYPRVWKVFTPLASERLGNAKLWVENLTRTTMDEHGTVHWLSSEGR